MLAGEFCVSVESIGIVINSDIPIGPNRRIGQRFNFDKMLFGGELAVEWDNMRHKKND
jgi:hypothetical protein